MYLKAVFFDFGGVLVRTHDWGLRTRWEQELGLAPGEASEIVFASESGRAAQLGQIGDSEHWRWIQRRLALDDQTLAHFRSDFFRHDELDRDLLAYILRLRVRYRVGLLSNASSNARALFGETYQVADHFDCIIISAEEGVMKPDPRIFTVALARVGAQAQEALLVDDALPNIEGARQIGMQALHFTEPLTARRQLAGLTGVV